MSSPSTDNGGRPRWSAAEAARRCAVSRSTIQRALAAGRIPGAEHTPEGWSIPLEGLLAAGFTPDRPSPPDPGPGHARADAEQVSAADQLAARVRELEAALVEQQRETERERLQRAAAEAIARERAEQIGDLRRTVAALEAGRSDRVPAPTVPAPVPAPVEQQQRRGLLERIAGRFGV
ncbi:hypothetical protein [Rhodococcus sp. YH1]|uniref:hypothetical protein n=1 Tax=Rhodococcus sp. YH1 TaxID=89066 RepID=UPI0013870DDD|nr:hypothetical protein [Rhodococcus sp. YH1]NCL78921.1 hypothetical protein [Rhodococcus sp. YH1]